MKRIEPALLSLTLTGALLLGSPLSADPVVLVGATIHPVSAEAIVDGILIVDGDRIVAMGADLEIPPGATVVDVTGKHIYPSLVHSHSTLGLTEIDSVRGTRDTHEIGSLNANIRAEVAFNADSQLLPVAASGGVLVANVVPQGGVFTGTSAVMRMSGWNWEDMTARAGTGMHLRFPEFRAGSRFRRRSQEEIDKAKDEAMKLIDETIADARAYDRAKQAAAEGLGPAVATDSNLEALLPVLSGELRLFIHAGEKTQIEGALDWAEKNSLTNIALVAGPDAQYVGERLAATGIPVVLDGVLRNPPRDWEPYDAAYAAAARLHEAGVRFAISDGGGASDARNLPFHAAMAAAFGLPQEVALESVTLAAAEILGVADRYGSLEVGKEATFIVTNGDPLEIRSRVERAWLGGLELDLHDRQKQLFERYDDRPRQPPKLAPRG